MTTTTRTKNPVTRTVAWERREGPGRGVVRIVLNGKTTLYAVARFEADFGRGYVMTNLTSQESYDVNTGEACGYCDCPSFNLKGEPCKYIGALRALEFRGLIN
jgi:hypothetical protein